MKHGKIWKSLCEDTQHSHEAAINKVDACHLQ